MTSGICPKCGALNDFSNLPSFSKISCDKCGKELIVPLIFGNYQLTKLIEENIIFKKYKGNSLNTEKIYFITILNKKFSDFRNCLDLCRKDAKDIHYILKHPGIIPILKYGEIENTFYLTEPYSEYYKLSDYNPKELGEFEANSVFNAFKTISAILREAHNKGFVHHNICSENILIDTDGSVKIQNFFISRVTYEYEAAMEREFNVSPYYISPEKAEKHSEEQKGDIFSLGVMLYYILTGRHPFEGDSDDTIIYSRIKRPKSGTYITHGITYKAPVSLDTIRKDIASEYAELIDSMLQPYPIQRPDASKIFTKLNLIEAAIEKRKKMKIYSNIGVHDTVKSNTSPDLQKALKNNELELHYQPIINMKKNNIVGVEAFLRWITPVGIIPPANFIPEAEKTNLINNLGIWAIDTACSQLSKWIKLGFNDLYVTVNISPSQLKIKDFEGTFSAILQKHNINYKQIEFEISQPPTSEPLDIPAEQYTEFARYLNSRVSIAELGTKYTSIKQNLSSLRLHSLKIDGNYIEDIRKAKKELATFNSVIALANFLSVPTVAEKVENKKQVNFLLKIGCSLAQGFYFYHPMPADQITDILLKKKHL